MAWRNSKIILLKESQFYSFKTGFEIWVDAKLGQAYDEIGNLLAQGPRQILQVFSSIVFKNKEIFLIVLRLTMIEHLTEKFSFERFQQKNSFFFGNFVSFCFILGKKISNKKTEKTQRKKRAFEKSLREK